MKPMILFTLVSVLLTSLFLRAVEGDRIKIGLSWKAFKMRWGRGVQLFADGKIWLSKGDNSLWE
jgi:hypothetical protein